MQQLSVKQKQYLKGLAHSLEPVVIIGANGITPAVIKEIDVSLKAHELIKIRILGAEREIRDEIIKQITSSIEAHFVQHIGKLLVFYRSSEKAKITLPKI